MGARLGVGGEEVRAPHRGAGWASPGEGKGTRVKERVWDKLILYIYIYNMGWIDR